MLRREVGKNGVSSNFSIVLQLIEEVTDQAEPVCVWNMGMQRVHLASVSSGDWGSAGWEHWNSVTGPWVGN